MKLPPPGTFVKVVSPGRPTQAFIFLTFSGREGARFLAAGGRHVVLNHSVLTAVIPDVAQELSLVVGGARDSWLSALASALHSAELSLTDPDPAHWHRYRGKTRSQIELSWLELAYQGRLRLSADAAGAPLASEVKK